MRISFGKRGVLIAALTTAALTATALAAFAAIPNSSTGVIDGCYKGETLLGGLLTAPKGSLRVIDKEAGEKCASGETPIQWNQKGEQGPQGIQGLPGKDGLRGTDGQAGADGQDGADGAPGPNWTIYTAGSSETVPAGTLFSATRSCNSGDLALGPTYDTSYPGGTLGAPDRSERTGPSTWAYKVANTSTVPLTIALLGIVCADTTP